MDAVLWIVLVVVVVALLVGAMLMYRRRTGTGNSADIARRQASRAEAKNAYQKNRRAVADELDRGTNRHYGGGGG